MSLTSILAYALGRDHESFHAYREPVLFEEDGVLKILHQPHTTSRRALRELKDEHRVAVQLLKDQFPVPRSDGVRHVTVDGVPYTGLVTEYVKGIPLWELSNRDAERYLDQYGEIAALAHTIGYHVGANPAHNAVVTLAKTIALVRFKGWEPPRTPHRRLRPF